MVNTRNLSANRAMAGDGNSDPPIRNPSSKSGPRPNLKPHPKPSRFVTGSGSAGQSSSSGKMASDFGGQTGSASKKRKKIQSVDGMDGEETMHVQVTPEVTEADFLSAENRRAFLDNFSKRFVVRGYEYKLSDFPGMNLVSLFRPWIPIVENSKPIFLLLVRLFFANMSIGENGDIHSFVRGVHITLNPDILATILKLENGGQSEYFGQKWDPKCSMKYDDALAIIMDGEDLKGTRIRPAQAPCRSRLMLHIMSSNVFRKTSHVDLEPMFNMLCVARLLSGKPCNLPYIMYKLIEEAWEEKEPEKYPVTEYGSLPFISMFTRIFEHFRVLTKNIKAIKMHQFKLTNLKSVH